MSGYLELPLVPERGPALNSQMEITESCDGGRGGSVFLLFQTELSDMSLFKHLERTHKTVFQF